MKYTYYRTCERCGAHLDPGERCDCEQEERRENFFPFPAEPQRKSA